MSVAQTVLRSNDTRNRVVDILSAIDIEVDGSRPSDLRVNDDRFFARVVRDRELGLGETYQLGWWDAERVDQLVAKLLAADLKEKAGSSAALLALGVRSRLMNRQTIRLAAKNAAAHYNVGNELFEIMLDKRMMYTCAYWRHAEDLDSAQEAKLELICSKLHLEPGMRVLDIGCGWGGLAQYLAERYDARVVGVSPASEQVKVAAARCVGLDVEIRQQDFRDVRGTFDRIVSVGMLEHVGSKNYKPFFDATNELLAPDGIMLHQTIGSNVTRNHTDPWFDKHVFPGGTVPSIEHLGRASAADWALEDVHNFGPDYDRTLMAWYGNIESGWDDLPEYDDYFRRTWRYYLLSSAASFRVRQLQLWQLVFTKARRYSAVYDAIR